MDATRDALTLTLWTDDPTRAACAQAAGVDRIGPDLERLGKQARQPTGEFWISPHRRSQLPALRAVLQSSQLFVRTDPLHPQWEATLEEVLADGVDVLMLPVFRSADDVARALAAIDGRARLVPLIETAEALADVARIAAVAGLAEVHFGLNDLGLALGARNRFAVLLDARMERACRVLADAGLRIGIGGIGRADDRGLPVDADLLYAAYARLGARATLIARSFLADIAIDAGSLARYVAQARQRFAHWQSRSPREQQQASDALREQLGTSP